MPLDYSPYVRHEVYLQLKNVPRMQRERVMRFMEALAKDPYQTGDYQDRTPEGREIQIKLIGSYAILFWADHAVREMKIVDFEKADA